MKKLLLVSLFVFPTLANAQEVKKYALRGVVTYYFNANYGDKADTGAKAFLLTQQQAEKLGITPDFIDNYRLLYAKFSLEGLLLKPEKRLTAADKQLKADLSQASDSLLKRQVRLEYVHKIPFLTADGSGVFTKNIAPGTYYVFVKSAHRRNASVAEIDGQMMLKTIVVKDDDLEVPIRFGMGV